jgi:hypothetical protein
MFVDSFNGVKVLTKKDCEEMLRVIVPRLSDMGAR